MKVKAEANQTTTTTKKTPNKKLENISKSKIAQPVKSLTIDEKGRNY